MKKDKVFVLRLSKQDLQTLNNVALRTKRTKSGAFRWALVLVAQALDEYPEQALVKQIKPA